MSKSVVIFSGGMDSATLLAYQVKALGNPHALTFMYGQRHDKEVGYAKQFAEVLRVPHEIVDISSIAPLIAKGSQTGGEPVPEGHYTEESMKATVVPNRNMIMLSLAIAYAITIGAEEVLYAAHSGDHAIYPDCRDEFVWAMQEAARLCDWSQIRIVAPFLQLTKAQIVALGETLGVSYEFTWSCYKGGLHHCGKCGTCVERKEAFKLAEVEDPTVYV